MRAGAENPRPEVGKGIAAEQARLEEEHRGVPDARGAAEQRQHHFRKQRLHHEEQRGAEKSRQEVDGDHRVSPSLLAARDNARLRRGSPAACHLLMDEGAFNRLVCG